MRRPGSTLRAGAAGLALVAGMGVGVAPAPTAPARPSPETESRWAAAVEALRNGDPGPALLEFAAPEAAQTPAADYLQYLRAEALLTRGDLSGARRAAESLAQQFPGRRVEQAALLLAAFAAAATGDEAGNEALLRRFLEAYPDSGDTPAVLYFLGWSFEARGQRENAARTYRQLTILVPASDYADGAADRLRLLEGAGVSLPPPSAAERVARAERLLRAGRAEAARVEAEAVAGDADRDLALRALGVVAAALGRLRRYEGAATVIEQILARAPVDEQSALRVDLGRMLYRAGKDEGALAALAESDALREADAAEAAYLRGLILEDLARLDEARAAYERTVARFPSREPAAGALWRLGWLAYLRDDRAGAVAHWSRLGEIAPDLRYRGAATYWTGRAREEMGSPSDAASSYERVRADAPRSYYGLLAAARVPASPTAVSAVPVALPDDAARALAGDPDVVRVDTLWRLGLPEYAAAEMEDLALRSITDRVKLFWLASEYHRQNRYHLALRILRRHFADALASGHPALPRTFWEAGYPIGWTEDLVEAAERAGIEPFLVAAVIREESSFYPLAQSRAGARGLMQLLPRTARAIALRRGLDLKSGEMLDEPGPNLGLGTTMLADLLKQFTDPRLAIAAYNAGPGKVREWWAARRTSDVEAFIEQIPYEETRVYVKRVVVAWEEYRRLYGARPWR